MAKQKTEEKKNNVLVHDYAYVNMEQMKSLVKQRFYNRDKKLRVLRFLGHRGVGKSQGIAQAAEELSRELTAQTGQQVNVQCKVLTLSVMEAPDFNGLPFVDAGKTLYAQPHFIPQEGYGILLLDEFSRAPHDIQQANLTFIENREVNGHKLGDGWVVVTADNPGMDTGGTVTYQVSELDPALKDRLATYYMQPSPKETVSFLAQKYGGEHPVVRWLTKDLTIIDYDGIHKTSPRSLEYMIKALNVHKEMDPYVVAAGEVGVQMAREYVNFLNNPENMTLEQLMRMDEVAEKTLASIQTAEHLNPTLFHMWNKQLVNRCRALPRHAKSQSCPDYSTDLKLATFIRWYLVRITNLEFWGNFICNAEYANDIIGVEPDLAREVYSFIGEQGGALKELQELTIKRNDELEPSLWPKA